MARWAQRPPESVQLREALPGRGETHLWGLGEEVEPGGTKKGDP